MLSAIFVDRPRLAIVIAIVTSIAGALALLTIPVAQYPDIVPPQVSVTTTYPGAAADVVESTVAQPIESQVVGVDKMIYMKSVSGNDGSYTLTASFELGTDPDINAVNVNNRVQIALAKLPEDVRKQGVTVKKKSSALLGVLAVYSPKGAQDPLFISNYVHHQPASTGSRAPGRRRRDPVGAAGLRDAGLGADRPTHRTRPHPPRRHRRHQGPERSGPGRADRRPAISDDSSSSLSIQTQGRLTSPEQFRNIVLRTNPTASLLRLGDVARIELGAASLDRETRLNGSPATVIAIYQSPAPTRSRR